MSALESARTIPRTKVKIGLFPGANDTHNVWTEGKPQIGMILKGDTGYFLSIDDLHQYHQWDADSLTQVLEYIKELNK